MQAPFYHEDFYVWQSKPWQEKARKELAEKHKEWANVQKDSNALNGSKFSQ